eukprot:g42537.t1
MLLVLVPLRDSAHALPSPPRDPIHAHSGPPRDSARSLWYTMGPSSLAVVHHGTQLTRCGTPRDPARSLWYTTGLGPSATQPFPALVRHRTQPLTDTEKTFLVHGLNYNYRDAKKTDFLAALESKLKSNGLMEEIQTIRQTIVPTLSRKGKWNTFNTEEKKALERLKKDRNILILPEFVNIVKETRIEEDEIMISFDVTALFTSINIDPAKETIATLLDESGGQAPHDINGINKDSALKLLDLCLTTHFSFNDCIFRQINGTPMGSPKSGLIAEA